MNFAILGSFILDPGLLFLAGIAFVAACGSLVRSESRYRLTRAVFFGLLLAVFYCISVRLFLMGRGDSVPEIDWMWRTLGSGSGREFMITSGFFDYPGAQSPPIWLVLLCGAIYATYPIWLLLGIRAGERWMPRIMDRARRMP